MKIRFSLICRSDKRHMYNLAKSSTSITEIEAHLEKTNSRDCVPGGTIDEPRLKDSREDAQVKGCYLKQRETSMLGRIYCRRPVNNRREWISKAVAFAVRSDRSSECLYSYVSDAMVVQSRVPKFLLFRNDCNNVGTKIWGIWRVRRIWEVLIGSIWQINGFK